MGKIALWAMLPWYLAVLPCVVLGGWWRTYVIVWGLLFFALSLFVLQLGWLAHFEFLFFAGLFWQSAFMRPHRSLKVAYDDRCNLCDRTVNFVKRVDIFGRVELKPVSENMDWLSQNGIRPDDAMTDLYGVESNAGNRTTSGYDFYVTLTRTIFLLLPFFPLLMVGKWLGIGPLLYRYIADRRTKLFGVCQIPTKKPDVSINVASDIPRSELSPADPMTPISAHLTALALVYLMLVPAPSIGWAGVPFPQPLRDIVRNAGDAAHIYGIAPINVFNKTDLRMAENWFTLTFISESGERTMIPILAEDGRRLSMHASDRVYFGHTLRYRRRQIGQTGCFFDDYEEMLGKFARYYQFSNDRVQGRFLYTQYHQPLPDVETLLAGSYIPNDIQQVCAQEFRLE